MSDGEATAPLTGRIGDAATPGTNSATFAAGDLIAERYRVVRFIARGGMGEVYEVRDIELREIVALKVIRAEIAAAGGAIERFKREINLARQITHPNVSRIFEFGKHEHPGHTVTFLTMELIRGEPLSARTGTPLPRAEVLELVRQIATAIDAAHARGIVHRDLKPGNVLREPGPPARVVVTDFGIAFVADDTSGPGEVVGSPAYMSPEQIAGVNVTPRSDLYSLGVIAYELVTGVRPAPADAGAAPASPRSHVPDLPRSWDEAILRMLARDPAERFSTAGAFVAALEPPRSRARTITLAVAAVIAIAGGAVVWSARRSAEPLAVTTAPIAILGFENASHHVESAWLSTAIAELLAAELVADRARVVPGDVAVRAKIELGIPDALGHPSDTLARIRKRLGSDFVIAGAYTMLDDDRLRLQVRIEDTRHGTTVATIERAGAASRLFELVDAVGADVRARLAVPPLTAGQKAEVRASLPEQPAAAQRYAEGLAKIRAGDLIGARTDLERAVAIDPRQPMIHAALSSVSLALGYDAKAATEAERAFESRAALGTLDQRTIEARYRQTRHEWDAALAIYTTLLREQPDNLERGLRLVSAEIDGARGTEALATIENLRLVLAPAALDPNLDLFESRAATLVGDQPRTLAAAIRGIDHAGALGARALVIEGWIYRANGEWALGRYDDASTSANHALDLLRDLPDDLQRARALATLGNIDGDRGNKPSAQRRYDEALAVLRKIGNQQGIAVVLNNMATDRTDLGDLDGAHAELVEVLAIARDIGDRKMQSFGELNLGEIARERGDLGEARARIDEQLANARDRGDGEATAEGLLQRGLIELEAGDSTTAIASLDDALARHRELALDAPLATDLVARARAAIATGDPAGAGTRLEEAIAIDRKVGRNWEQRNATVWRSFAWLAEGRAEPAEAALRELLATLSPDATELAAFAHAVRAWALAALHRHADADTERTLAAHPMRTSRRYAAALALARSQALGDRKAAAIAALVAVRADADQRGFRAVVRDIDAELARLRK